MYSENFNDLAMEILILLQEFKLERVLKRK